MSKKIELCFKGAILFFVLSLILPMHTAVAKEKNIEATTTGKVTDTVGDPIKIASGLISGKTLGEAGKEVRAYLGIPYAAPPVGNLRWKPPQPVVPWSGIRKATQYSKTAVQSAGGPFDFFPQDEDCLYLNVITPAKNANEKLPVMVWFHGGGYAWGSGNNQLFNNYRLPQHGVIVVSVNMRLGIFGLLAHPLLSAESQQGVSGNYMFLDMLASLKWVKNNIGAFGGDPDNVTIFGVSSGGGKVAALVASPLGKGLFKRGICESGSADAGKSALSDLEKTGEKFFKLLKVTTLEEARKIPWKDIKEQSLAANCSLAVDGWFIKDSPANIFASGKQNPVQMMVGLNQGELDFGMDIVSDYVSMLSGLRKLGVDGYAYIFDQVPSNWKKKGGKAVHALELFYVFGDYDHKTTEDWPLMYQQESRYGIGPEDKDPVMTEIDKKVSEEMMSVWAQFAKTENPSVKGLIAVPAWEPGSDKYLYISDPLQIKSGFSTLAK